MADALEGILRELSDLRRRTERLEVLETPSATASSLPWVNVKDYGAVGDGTTDDTAAIQAAFDYNPGGVLTRGTQVVFPRGTYLITDTLDLTNRRNVTLCGVEPIGSAIHAHIDGKPIVDTVGSSWIMVENLTLDGDGTLTPNVAFLHARSDTADGINASWHTYTNVRVTGSYTLGGWYNYSGENFVWDRCYTEFTAAPEFGIVCCDTNYKSLASEHATIRTLASCTRLTFRGCAIQEWTSATWIPLRLQSAGGSIANVVIEDCYLASKNTGDCGIYLVGGMQKLRIADVFQESTIDYIIHSAPSTALAAETQSDVVVRNVFCPTYTAAAIKADQAITYRGWDVWGAMGGNPDSVLDLWILDQSRIGKWWTAETASSGVTAQSVTKSEVWREPSTHTWTVSGTENYNVYHDTTEYGVKTSLKVVGTTTNSDEGVDSVRIGVVAGTPRLVLEDDSSVYEIDNLTGTLRFINGSGLQASLDGSGNFYPQGSLVASGAIQGIQAIVSKAAGNTRLYLAQTAGSNRWAWGATDTAEGGSNAGSDFNVWRYADDGTYLGSPLFIARATGHVTVANGFNVGSASGADTGDVDVSGHYEVDGTQVVGNQGAAVADASEDIASVKAQLNALLARLRAHGLIAT